MSRFKDIHCVVEPQSASQQWLAGGHQIVRGELESDDFQARLTDVQAQ